MKLKNNLQTLFYLGFDACIFPGEDFEVPADKWESFKDSAALKALIAAGSLTLTEDAPAEEPAPKKLKKA
jgi:hypothetical protein